MLLKAGIFKSLLSSKLLTPASSLTSQKAGLKATYGEKYPYSDPFPYDQKRYNVWRSMFDQTMHRLNENSKIIVVEGNVGVGKTEFAKKIAEGFDLKFFGPLSDESCFIEPHYGMDLRCVNNLLPASCTYYDLQDFYNDPNPQKGTAGKLAIKWYKEKFFYYARAMKHLLSTGQGVVMATSVYSDMVYVDALRRIGWCSKEFVSYYNDLRDNSLCELYKPHLTIFLDAPLNVVKERIAENKPQFKNAKNLNDTYLNSVDESYKNLYLPFARKYGEVIEVDWTEKANKVDMDTIIEEMQLLRLECLDLDDVEFSDWNRNNDHDFLKLRQLVDCPENLNSLVDRVDPLMCDELTPSADDLMRVDRIFRVHPVLRGVPPGFAREFGHKTLFKL